MTPIVLRFNKWICHVGLLVSNLRILKVQRRKCPSKFKFRPCRSLRHHDRSMSGQHRSHYEIATRTPSHRIFFSRISTQFQNPVTIYVVIIIISLEALKKINASSKRGSVDCLSTVAECRTCSFICFMAQMLHRS